MTEPRKKTANEREPYEEDDSGVRQAFDDFCTHYDVHGALSFVVRPAVAKATRNASVAGMSCVMWANEDDYLATLAYVIAMRMHALAIEIVMDVADKSLDGYPVMPRLL